MPVAMIAAGAVGVALVGVDGAGPRHVRGQVGGARQRVHGDHDVDLGEPGHLLAGDGVADQNDPSETERIENGGDVGDECVEVTRRRGAGRRSKAATREAEDVKAVGELRGERIEDVGGVSKAGEEYQRRPAPAPIHHFERYAWPDRCHLDRRR